MNTDQIAKQIQEALAKAPGSSTTPTLVVVIQDNADSFVAWTRTLERRILALMPVISLLTFSLIFAAEKIQPILDKVSLTERAEAAETNTGNAVALETNKRKPQVLIPRPTSSRPKRGKPRPKAGNACATPEENFAGGGASAQ